MPKKDKEDKKEDAKSKSKTATTERMESDTKEYGTEDDMQNDELEKEKDGKE